MTARARIFSSPNSPKPEVSVSHAPFDGKNMYPSGDDDEVCKISMIDSEKTLTIGDGGTSSRVAILRDRKKGRIDPDYDRSYESFHADHEMMHLRDMEFAHSLRQSKVNLKICQYSYELLLQYLHKTQSITMLGVINEHINFQVSPRQPSSISDDEGVTLVGSGQDAANLINQKEIHWGFLQNQGLLVSISNDNDIQRRSSVVRGGVEEALQEQERISRASGKQDLEELMREVQEARRIKMLHQPSKVMDMEHELRALRVQLSEKSKHSLQLQKEDAIDKKWEGKP